MLPTLRGMGPHEGGAPGQDQAPIPTTAGEVKGRHRVGGAIRAVMPWGLGVQGAWSDEGRHQELRVAALR